MIFLLTENKVLLLSLLFEKFLSPLWEKEHDPHYCTQPTEQIILALVFIYTGIITEPIKGLLWLTANQTNFYAYIVVEELNFRWNEKRKSKRTYQACQIVLFL